MTFLQKATPSSGFKEPDEGPKDVGTVPASFEPSSGSLEPLEGVAFCRKVISFLRPLYPPILGTPCLKNIAFHEYVSKFAFSRPRTRMRAHLANARACVESPADTVNLVVTNYPEMYLDVNRVAFKKHTDLLLFLVLSVK